MLSTLNYIHSVQWSYKAINALSSSEITLGDPSVAIALIDTGVEILHPEIIHSISTNSENITDLDGHGTFCAGILVGSGHENIYGIAPQCTLIPIKVPYNNHQVGYVSTFSYFIAEGIKCAVNQGAKVINISFTTLKDSKHIREAVKYAQDKGCLLIAPAGQDNTHQKCYPAAYEGILSVGAINRNNEKLEESNYGDWVSVCAPGKNIESIYLNNTTAIMSGTSIACPYVTGLAALLFSLAKDKITAEEVKQIIESTCNPLQDSTICRYGIIDVQKALEECRCRTNH